MTVGSDKEPGRRWIPAIVYSSGDLTGSEPELAKVTGLDPFTVDRAIAIGVARDQAFRFDGGFTAEVVRAKPKGLGAKPRRIGQDGLSFSPGPEPGRASAPRLPAAGRSPM